MKHRGIMIHTVGLRPSMLRSVSFSKKRKRFLLYHYGTSSKPASPNLSSKLNVFNTLKNISDSFMPTVWKSAAAASAFFNDITSQFVKTSTSSTVLEKSKTVSPSTSTDNKDKSDDVLSTDSSSKVHQDNANLPTEVGATVIQNTSLTADINAVSKKAETIPELEQTFFEWLTGSDTQSKRKEFLGKNDKVAEKRKKVLISKSSLQQRSRFLVHSLCEATSSASQLLRLEEVCKHLILYPDQKSIMCKAGLVRLALRLKYHLHDQAVQAQARCVLSLVGCHDPPRGNGIRILSIDGGGTRGILAMEILRQLEIKTNKKVYELFDFFCGVSSGAILCLLLGGLQLSIDECESLYRKLSDEIFKQSTFWGTGRLMWTHAYYETTTWVNVLKKTFGEKLIIDTCKDQSGPKLAAVSAIMNLPHLHPYVFRNYDFPPGVQSYYRGSCKYRMWEAVRASGAAPGYFEEYCLDDYLHQDGGIMINNPTALAIHEAQLLWPSDPIQSVLSLGTGRYIPSVSPHFTSTSLKTKVLKVIDSATDTEAVHIALNDLLSPNTYFRMNPYLTEFLTLDENRSEKLDQMKSDAQMYLRRNDYKLINAARTLTVPRSYYKNVKDFIHIRRKLYL